MVIVNWVAQNRPSKGLKVKGELLGGLVRIYQDPPVARYYDSSLPDAYRSRFSRYRVGGLAMGVASIIIPLLVLNIGD